MVSLYFALLSPHLEACFQSESELLSEVMTPVCAYTSPV